MIVGHTSVVVLVFFVFVFVFVFIVNEKYKIIQVCDDEISSELALPHLLQGVSNIKQHIST